MLLGAGRSGQAGLRLCAAGTGVLVPAESVGVRGELTGESGSGKSSRKREELGFGA